MTGVARALPRTTSAPDGAAPEERRHAARADVAQVDVAQVDVAQIDVAQVDVAQVDVAQVVEATATVAPAVIRAVPIDPVPHRRSTTPGPAAEAPAAVPEPEAAVPSPAPDPSGPGVPAAEDTATEDTATENTATGNTATENTATEDTVGGAAALDASSRPDAPARRGRTAGGPGRRELRRQETRARIVDVAADLFAERGFEAVSVMEIARRAGVVEKTVFNHFPVKEGLVFDADPPVRTALLDAVRRRPVGESVSAAAGTFVVTAMSRLGERDVAAGLARMARIVRGSRTLQVREREILGDMTAALAELIAEETDARSGQLEPWLTAHAVMGLYAGLLELARDRALAGVSGPPLAAELRRRGQRGLSLLQFGLAGYAKRR